MFKTQYAAAVKKMGTIADIYHEGCQECVRSFGDEGARYPV